MAPSSLSSASDISIDEIQSSRASSSMPPPSSVSTTLNAIPQPLGGTPELIGYEYKIKGIKYTFKEKTCCMA
jgi:hypothetical protein